MKIRKMYNDDVDVAGGGYVDFETIDYEGVVDGIRQIRGRVDTELSGEITKLGNLAEELVAAWKSPTSLKTRGKVDDMKVDLKKASDELGLLVAEVEKYNIAAKAIDEGIQTTK